GVDCLTAEFGEEVIIPAATRHLSMFGNEMVAKKPGMLKSAQKLRSFLLLDRQRNITKLSKSFFLSFTSIRALDCSGSRIKKLSNSIGTLLHLRCVELPQLGKLPFLEVLTIDGMDSAMYFCGSSGEKDLATRFASLKKLTLRNMPCLLGWSVNEDHGILPRLKKFTCEACPYLNNLPDLPSLNSLELSDCSSELLAVTAAKVTSLTHLMISEFLELIHLPEGLLKNNISLLSVEIRDCPQIRSLSSELKVLPCLESLSISNCRSLSSVLDSCGLGTLKSFSIHGCHNISLEKGLQSLQFLQYASLSDCGNLTTLPMTMQHLTSLQTLHIWSCSEMYMLPEWLGDLSSLRELELWYCENLSSVPESVKKLTKLQFLSIWGCPNLGLRCRKDVGEDWHKIKHVPFIKINGPYIQAMTGINAF
ncbi:hypothetical protein HAX54_019785, partial [Datura stramonium]|nr:hypothetical protein [Datura stramonium]